MNERLSRLVSGAAAKRLSAVEARPDRSNQHEFNGVQSLKLIFGEERRTFEARFVYLADESDEPSWSDGFVTWYDAREAHPTRSEYRLYFPTVDATASLQEGDLALILRRTNGPVLIAFAAQGSTAEQQLLWTFSLASPAENPEVRNFEADDQAIGFAAREVLAQLGLEPPVADPAEESYLPILLDRFEGGFPPTAAFSQFARDLVAEEEGVDPVADPDGALMAWLEREEALFRQLERHLVLGRLREGFEDDVDAFIQFSLSVQNRRKSRVGHALVRIPRIVISCSGAS